MSHADLILLGRIAVAAAASFALGFERELRGAPVGDRTFALIGTGSASVTAVAIHASPQAVAGVLTGIGFVGAGLVFRGEGGTLLGATSAATIFAVAAIGVVAGAGHLVLALLVAAFVLFDLELRHLPGVRVLDARRYQDDVADDFASPAPRSRKGS